MGTMFHLAGKCQSLSYSSVTADNGCLVVWGWGRQAFLECRSCRICVFQTVIRMCIYQDSKAGEAQICPTRSQRVAGVEDTDKVFRNRCIVGGKVTETLSNGWRSHREMKASLRGLLWWNRGDYFVAHWCLEPVSVYQARVIEHSSQPCN